MLRPLDTSEPMLSVLPESQGLEGDDDDDDDDSDECKYSCHSVHSSHQSKSNDSSDDSETEDLGEPTAFSLTPKHSNTVEDKQVELAKNTLELEEEGQELQEPFYKDMVMSDSLSGEKKPSPTQHFPGHQRTPALQTASTAQSGSHDSFQRSADQHRGMEAAAPQAHANDPYVGHPQYTTGAVPHMLHKEAIGDRKFSSLQLNYGILREQNRMIREENKALRDRNLALEEENFALREIFYCLRADNVVLMEENVMLHGEYNMFREQYDRLRHDNDILREDNATVRSLFKNFQCSLETQAHMMSSQQEQLKTSLADRRREAQELESSVQQTKSHLQLMTGWALDAERNIERLKQKIFFLQGQLDSYSLERKKPKNRPAWGQRRPT